MKKSLVAGVALLGSGLALSSLGAACGGSQNSSFSNNASSSGASSSGNGSGNLLGGGASSGGGVGADGGPCTGIQCQIHSCATGSTTISGKIFDPAGKNPLYNVVAYVPNSTPDPLTPGIDAASCSCEALYTGQPIATALTDASGSFTIQNAPDGANIPLVIQIGKWRRQITIPSVTQCADTALTDGTLTLPKNQSEGDIPSIAVSTGSADSLECLLLRVGLDPAEYGGGAGGSGRIHIFQGGTAKDAAKTPNTVPPGPASATSLWDDPGDVDKYDIVLLSCEGSETANPNPQTMYDYVDKGGRLFAEHYHYAFFGPTTSDGSGSPPFPADLATWSPDPGGGQDEYAGPINGTINTSFPKGVALNTWLGNVNALSGGELPIAVARYNALVGPANTPSTAWIQSDKSANPPSSQYFSWDQPIGGVATDAGLSYCGRVVYSDLHVGAEEDDYAKKSVGFVTPTGCVSGALSPDEKALEFMLFDLSACVTPIGSAPQPPIPTGPAPK